MRHKKLGMNQKSAGRQMTMKVKKGEDALEMEFEME